MIEGPTVFILGAGASEPYGFPLGRKLVDQAIALLRRTDEFRVEMLTKACHCATSDLLAFASALESAASPSVDVFLENREEYLKIGKAVIAALLIPCEIENDLFTREQSPERLKGRWYDYVLNRMTGK